MTSGPESTDPASEVIERLADPAPALLLLRYVDARLPASLATRLRGCLGHPVCHLLHYRVDVEERAPGSATDLVQDCVRLAASGPSPALLLLPQYPPDGILPPDGAARFWKQLNAQREALGHLDARILLCLDPGHERYAATHARDLLSWCAPKFVLLDRLPVAEGAMAALGAESILRSRSEAASDQSRLQARSLGPLWDEIIAAGRPPTAAEVERLGLPLLEANLQEGRIMDAGRVEQSIAAVPPSAGPAKGTWLRLRGDLARAHGRFDEAAAAYEAAVQSFESLLQHSPKSDAAKRSLTLMLLHFADFLNDRRLPGDSPRAFALLERAFRLGQQVAEANPQSAQAARELAASSERLGVFLMGRGEPGDLEQALDKLQRSLSLSEGLLAASPQSRQPVLDVAVSLERLGDLFGQRDQSGDAARAISHYRRSLELRESLLKETPQSAPVAREVAVSLERMGQFLVRRLQPGDGPEALGYLERSLKLREKLLAANPQSSEATRDVAVSLNQLGDFLFRRGRPEDTRYALTCYRRCLELSQRLLAAKPQSAELARDVMVSLGRLAVIEGARPGGEGKALEYRSRAVEIALRLLENNPQSVFRASDAAGELFLTYQLAVAAGKEDLARQSLTRCFAILDRFIAAGSEFDPPLMNLHAQLKPMFSRA